MLGHFPNSHFLQAGFCLLSAPEVTSIALSRKLTIFSQRSSGLACLLLKPFCSPESRISMLLLHNHCLHWLLLFFFLKQPSPATHAMPLALLKTLQDPVQVTQMAWEVTPTSRSLRLLMTQLLIALMDLKELHPCHARALAGAGQAPLPTSRHWCCRCFVASPLYFQIPVVS